MNQVYPESIHFAKRPERDLAAELDEVCRVKVAELVQAYLEAEVDELLGRLRYARRGSDDCEGHRDGHDPQRTVTTSIGPIPIRRPRVRGIRHESRLIPKYRRRLPSIDKTVHQLWIEGLAHRDFEPTLRGLLGDDAPLSASTIARVNAEFQAEFDAWQCRRIDERFVYLWADGIHLGAGPGDERRVLLVVLGCDPRGIKHLVALDEAMSESELSWSELFEDLKKRGLLAPQLIIADGANGLWAAATSSFPSTAQQRCWLHKIRNVLDKVPKKLQPNVLKQLRETMHAETAPQARQLLEDLARSLQRDYPKAAECLRDDVERMLTFHRFPKSSWKNLRTTNPIESIFASVRLRTNAAKRLRSGRSARYLVFKLIQRLSSTWRRIDGFQNIALAQKEAA